MVAVVLALLLALVTLEPWLVRYLPWRWERLRRLRAAHRVIRTAPDVTDASIERALTATAAPVVSGAARHGFGVRPDAAAQPPGPGART